MVVVRGKKKVTATIPWAGKDTNKVLPPKPATVKPVQRTRKVVGKWFKLTPDIKETAGSRNDAAEIAATWTWLKVADTPVTPSSLVGEDTTTPTGTVDAPSTPTIEPWDVKWTAEQILAQNTAAWQKLEELKETKISDLETAKETDIERTETHAKELQDLLTKQDEKLSLLEDERRVRLEDEKAWEVERLQKEKDLSMRLAEADREKLEASQEYQRIQNENSIIEAEAAIEIERQQSAWAYQKLWLGFSSWIINQSQQIATDWIAAIAQIKAKMSYNEAFTWVEISKVGIELEKANLQYSWLINQTINTYSDKLDDLDEQAEKRIQDTTKSLLLSTQEKEEAIDGILKDYRSEVGDLERQHIDDMIKIQDRWYKYQIDIQNQIEKDQGLAKENINDKITSWALFEMNDVELDTLARKAWLNLIDLTSIKKSSIAKSVSANVSKMMGEGYITSEETRAEINGNVHRLMEGWSTLEEATAIATKQVLSETPEYKARQSAVSLEERKFAFDKAKFGAEYALDQAKAREEARQFDVENQDYTAWSGWTSELLDFISSAEWTNWNYEALFWAWSQTKTKITNMTLKELQKFQQSRLYLSSDGENYIGWAMGKYQIVSWTLRGLIRDMGLTWNEKFTPELQDKMAMKLMGSSFNDFKSWKITPQQFQKRISGIWASLPKDAGNESTYKWVAWNRALTSSSQLLSMLDSVLKGERPTKNVKEFADKKNKEKAREEKDIEGTKELSKVMDKINPSNVREEYFRYFKKYPDKKAGVETIKAIIGDEIAERAKKAEKEEEEEEGDYSALDAL